MGVTIIEYKGKKILYVDHRGAKTEEETASNQKQGVKIQEEAVQAGHKMYDTLVNMEEVNIASKMTTEEMKQAFKDVPHKIAVVGVSGIMETIQKGVNTYAGLKNVGFFKTEEEAKEWLVS